ncbi:hypothetical protein CBR_g17896 [Chara braunii]|uniref:Uncharacterized protein n=1 Tax=Chara braunii TaxID=69332 RepID=A0A388KW57_CHABU|nr:hypothetical protein CBR_g17896 [Chara braunii]|eukprot:GBG74183.1 hypothetical protein CBR_g17896 [Chara braunii]
MAAADGCVYRSTVANVITTEEPFRSPQMSYDGYTSISHAPKPPQYVRTVDRSFEVSQFSSTGLFGCCCFDAESPLLEKWGNRNPLAKWEIIIC